MTTEAQDRTPDAELASRAPEHDGVATQRDLRETERFILARIDASERRLQDRIDIGFRDQNAKIDRLTWIIIGGLVTVLATVLAGFIA